MFTRLTLLLTALALSTATLGAQAPKSKRKGASGSKTHVSEPPAPGPNVVRQAPCVLSMKGTVVRKLLLPRPKKMANPAIPPQDGPVVTSKEVTERFEYEIPGTLEEEAGSGGAVRFRFTPAEDLVAAEARGTLHFEEKATGVAPVVIEATEVVGSDKFVFESAGRGQGIIPSSGNIFLKGRLQSPPPPGSPVSMEAPVRPISSIPMPPVSMHFGHAGTPALQFQGSSLWAWANSKGPFTVSGTLDYGDSTALQGGQASISGSVEVTFRIGATR